MQFKAFAPYNLRMKAAPGLTQMFTTKEITGKIVDSVSCPIGDRELHCAVKAAVTTSV